MCSGALRDILEHVRKVCSKETAKGHVKNKDDRFTHDPSSGD
jgi:hypothetical protein